MRRTALWPKRNSVYPIFSDAGHGWLHGTDLYDQHFWALQIDEYRYSPLVAALFVPLSLLPDNAGGVIWRLLNMAVFFGGLIAYQRTVFPGRTRLGWASVASIGWLLIPLGLPSLNNGQANPLVIGGLLFAVVAAYQGRWNLAAFALAGPILLKVYPLAVALLLLLIYPRQLGWRLGILLVLGLVLPFALQDPAYVVRQYEAWFAKLARGSQRAPSHGYLPRFLDAGALAQVPMPHRFYLPLQLATAAGIAGMVLLGRLRRWAPNELLYHLFNLSCCWMILFGPATENSTFILIAPTYAIAVWEGFAYRRPVWTRGVLAAIVCIFVGSALLTALPNGRNWAYPLNPLATLLLMGERVCSLWRRMPRQEDRDVTRVSARAA